MEKKLMGAGDYPLGKKWALVIWAELIVFAIIVVICLQYLDEQIGLYALLFLPVFIVVVYLTSKDNLMKSFGYFHSAAITEKGLVLRNLMTMKEEVIPYSDIQDVELTKDGHHVQDGSGTFAIPVVKILHANQVSKLCVAFAPNRKVVEFMVFLEQRIK